MRLLNNEMQVKKDLQWIISLTHSDGDCKIPISESTLMVLSIWKLLYPLEFSNIIRIFLSVQMFMALKLNQHSVLI